MAQQLASTGAAAVTGTAEPPSGGFDSKLNAHLSAGLTDYLKRYNPLMGQQVKNTLDGRYLVDLTAPLPEFNTKTALAYAASDTMDRSKTLYALVCNPGTIQRYHAILRLKTIQHPNLMNLVAAGPVELSQPDEERFVIFYDRPQGKKLSELLASVKGPLNENFMLKNVIAPIASAIQQLADLEISHGFINPENIYFSDTPVLGDCVSQPCGYSQPFAYEPLERMQALPAGKGEGTTAHDYYALAVVVLYLLHGPNHFAGMTQPALILSILREGVYNALTRNKDTPVIFHDFFRGLLSQSADDRWDGRYLKPWLDGKRYNVLLPPAPVEAMRPFEFYDMEASTRRELAHIFYLQWSHIPEVIQNGHLLQWVSVSLRNKELADGVRRITASIKELNARNEVQMDEQLMRVITLLDTHGPIRINQLSLHVDGIDALYAELLPSQSPKELLLLSKVIEFNLSSYWLDQQRKKTDYVMPAQITTAVAKLDRARISIRNASLGFGPERILYDLNPDMACQSPYFPGQYINSLPALLTRLDRMAPTQAHNRDPIDRHIAAYIASKINIQHEVRLPELTEIPSLASHPVVIALKLLSTAQSRAGNIPLPGLTNWIGLRLLPALDVLRSRTLKNRIKSALVEQARFGYLQPLVDLIIDGNYASADRSGYKNAWALYQTNIERIYHLRKGRMLDQQSSSVGYVIARTLAYVAFFITLATLLQKT